MRRDRASASLREIVLNSYVLLQLSSEFLITFINRGLTEIPLTIEEDFYRQLN